MTLDELNERIAQAQIDFDQAQAEIDQAQAEIEEAMAGLEEKRKAAGQALQRALAEFYDAADATRTFARTRLESERVRDQR